MVSGGSCHHSLLTTHHSPKEIEMSKQIKQMEMDALNQTFKDVRDLVALNTIGLDCHVDNQIRLTLRKKNIRLQVVKNSLARKVFDGLGLRTTRFWDGPTTIAWGGNSL